MLKAFAGPFLLTFAIACFVLMMQFLWKYFEDFAGKGLEWYIIAELLTLAMASFILYAVPMAVLLASLMTYGRLGENYELVAIKSGGISMTRVIAPLFVVAFFVSTGLFFFANYAIPFANLNFYSLLYDITEAKPILQLQEGIFYNGIDGYSIRAGKINPINNELRDIIIYDHTGGKQIVSVTVAESGKMEMTPDRKYLTMILYNGSTHEPVSDDSRPTESSEYERTYFRELHTRFDLSGFKLTRTDKQLFMTSEKMMNIGQIDSLTDTLKKYISFRKHQTGEYMKPYFHLSEKKSKDDSVSVKDSLWKSMPTASENILERFPPEKRNLIMGNAIGIARSIKGYTEFIFRDTDETKSRIRRAMIEYNRKFSLAVACIVLLLIGAPLGAIIRKGGLGLPIVVAILIFVFYWLAMVNGEKLAREGIFPVWLGMWLPNMILFPLGLFFVFKVATDSPLFNTEFYMMNIQRFFRRIFGGKKDISA